VANFDQRELRNALGRFATGITIITTLGVDGKAEGLTANSFSAVSLEPPLVLWCMLKNSPSLAVFEGCTHFAINILRSNQRALSHHFATPATDKFIDIEWSEGLGGAPLLSNCLAQFECRHETHQEGGDHLIFIGHSERFHYADGQPLLFNAGRYGVAAEHPDNFGDAADASAFDDLMML
jgi:flavin reductase (DIM6/NTAB) family NADH-FMN oxidoreductase RutF